MIMYLQLVIAFKMNKNHFKDGVALFLIYHILHKEKSNNGLPLWFFSFLPWELLFWMVGELSDRQVVKNQSFQRFIEVCCLFDEMRIVPPKLNNNQNRLYINELILFHFGTAKMNRLFLLFTLVQLNRFLPSVSIYLTFKNIVLMTKNINKL